MFINRLFSSLVVILAIPLVSVYLALFSSVDVALILVVLGTIAYNSYVITIIDIKDMKEKEQN